MRLFALSGSEDLGASVARALAVGLDRHEERDFEDGEHKARPLVSVRGADVYVIHALAGGGGASANDRLVKLLFFIAACRENGAARVTAVAPYIAYARKDRQTKRRDPVTTRYVAQLFEAVGASRVVTLDAHNQAAFQNAFRCETVHLEARPLFAPRIQALAQGMPVTILSPDSGGVKRAHLLLEHYESVTAEAAGFAFMEKHRSGGVVSGALFAGEVAERAVFIVDDMISTGGTLRRAAEACRARGAGAVFALATHGLFGDGAEALLADAVLDRVLVTDSLASAGAFAARFGDEGPDRRVQIVACGPLLGEAIRRLHAGLPVSTLTGLAD